MDYACRYPDERREEIWQEYLHLSGDYRQKLDLSLLCTHECASDMTPDMLKGFCTIGFEGIFRHYSQVSSTTSDNQLTEVDGVPVFRACNQKGPVDALVANVRSWTPRARPAFVYCTLNNWMTRMEFPEWIIKRLGPEYIAVTPDQLVGLYKQLNK
jgi:hypothetical protein